MFMFKDYQPGIISQKYKKQGSKYSLMFLMLAHATLTSSYVFSTITTIQHMKGNSTVALPDRLPYYSWMPFSYDTGPKYLLAMAYQAGLCFKHIFSTTPRNSNIF